MRERGYLLGALTIVWLGCVSHCLAAPPSSEFASESTFYGLHLKSNAAPIAALKSMNVAFKSMNREQGITKTLKSPARTPPILDLRIPETVKANNDLPSEEARHSVSTDSKTDSVLAQLSFAKSMSPAENFANRVHREGLPAARLWENKSALVSLGLNQRGKPGLWLIQKTH
jgi:hypothetical protein